MADEPTPSRLPRALRNTRLWVTLLWTLTLAVGLAGWDWAELHAEDAAAGQTMILLPRDPLDEGAREAVRARLAGEAGVASASWIAPAELARRLSQRFPQAEWQDLFPADEAWLSWVLEIRPAAPLDTLALMRDFAARRQHEGAWRLALWDPTLLETLARQRGALRVVLGFWLGLVALAGVAALLRLPLRRGERLGMVAWSAFLGVLGPGAVWSAALLAGAEPDPRTLGVALGAGLLLSALIAPLLRLPEGNRHISLMLGEDAHERIR